MNRLFSQTQGAVYEAATHLLGQYLSNAVAKFYHVRFLLQETRTQCLKIRHRVETSRVCPREVLVLAAMIATTPHARRRSGTPIRKHMDRKWRRRRKKRKKRNASLEASDVIDRSLRSIFHRHD
jgi:hypothetical protein